MRRRGRGVRGEEGEGETKERRTLTDRIFTSDDIPVGGKQRGKSLLPREVHHYLHSLAATRKLSSIYVK